MSSTVQATDGTMLPLDSLAIAIAWAGGFPTSFTVVYNAITYVQTLTNNGTNITDVSQWVPS